MQCNKERWRNWEGNQECLAEVCHATNLDDLRTIIKRVTMEGKSIRFAGGGSDKPGAASFSVSPVVKNEDGIIVKLKNLNKGYVHDDHSGKVTVEAGMTIAELEELVAKNHLSFEAMLVPPFVEVGGAVALGCHGSGFNHGTLSDQVVSITNVFMALQKDKTVIAPAHKVFHYQKYFPRRLWDVSYGFDIGSDFGTFQNVWNFVTDKVCEFAKPRASCTSASPFSYERSGTFPQNFVMHARFIKNSDAYLAPSFGNSHTCMLQLITYFGTNREQYFGQVEAYILSVGGRPHWGKTFNTEIDFGKLYGENMEKFNRIRRQMDPQGIFLNDFTRRVFAA